MYVYVVGCILDVCVDVCIVTRATVDHMDMDMEASMKYRKVVMWE